MKFFSKKSSLLISLLILIISCKEKHSELIDWLNSIEGLEIEKIEPDSVFTDAYRIFVPQFRDHDNPAAGMFMQQIILSHIDKNAPVVIDIEGYEAVNRTMEVTQILNSNQIEVEHRYFGKSRPDSIGWKYLNIKQAAADHHRIIELFKEYYAGDWISSGISKGGQAVMYHKRFYPDDVMASIAYVAPLNFSDEDVRIYHFLDNVGEEDCRDRITAFQRIVLQEKHNLIPLLINEANEKDLEYSIGLEKGFEYIVLEYSFYFWQWANSSCSEIPDSTATFKELYEHLSKNSAVDLFADSGIKRYESSYYQAFTEMGFYAYEIDKFEGLLEYSDGSNTVWYHENFDVEFDSTVMRDINNWIQYEGDNIIYIYGEYDPWGATGVQLTGETNSLKMVLEKGSHRTRIKHFSDEDKEIILSTLESWLDINIEGGNEFKYNL